MIGSVKPTVSVPEPFYSNASFYRFVPLSLAYTLVAHFASLLMKPFPCQLSIAPEFPEDRFTIAPRKKIFSSALTEESDESNENSQGPLAIVTGSNCGIGFETSASLASLGYTVILACRSKDKAMEAIEKINKRIQSMSDQGSARGKAVFLAPLDLSSIESVKSFSDAFKEKYSYLNVLVNNAGINTSGVSVDGMDLCYQTNFLGHFLLTRLLLKSLLKAKNFYASGDDVEAGRVVNLSSVTHHFSGCNEARNGGQYFNSSRKHNKKWWDDTSIPGVSHNTYKESKLAALVFSHALNKRFKTEGLVSVAANPGSVDSSIWRHYPPLMQKIHKLIYINEKQGSYTSVASAVGRLPENALYLQPYWQPFRTLQSKMKDRTRALGFRKRFNVPIPFCEMLGPFIGYAVTEPRLPFDLDKSANDLWDSSSELVGLEK